MDPLIEGYLSYLAKVGRKAPRTIIDVRCTLRRALAGVRPGLPLWHVALEDYLHWLERERQHGRRRASWRSISAMCVGCWSTHGAVAARSAMCSMGSAWHIPRD